MAETETFTLRVQHKAGTSTLSLPRGLSVSELTARCRELLGEAQNRSRSVLLRGFPPHLLLDASKLVENESLILATDESHAVDAAAGYSQGHTHPPYSLRWLNRDGFVTEPLHLFIQCCGMVGKEENGFCSTEADCDGSVLAARAGAAAHSGALRLATSRAVGVSRKRARQKPCDELGVWECCGARALPRWEESWRTKHKRVPLSALTPSCAAPGGPPALALVPIPVSRPSSPAGGSPSKQPRVRPPSMGFADRAAAVQRRLEAGPPTPPAWLAPVLLSIFSLTPEEAALPLWLRGAGGDGRAEELACRGDRLLESSVVGHLPKEGWSQERTTLAIKGYCSNLTLSRVAKAMDLPRVLVEAEGGSWKQAAPNLHTCGSLVEALLMTCYELHGAEAASEATARLMRLADETRKEAGEGEEEEVEEAAP